ncbi:MAG TPA: 50S ribosomal protein L3 [Ignavibacteria bacterium]|nr:50S ribosomal protein L3 [Bacteroidota bacterium]HRE12212.1 50S ribosomal protein L3 [Ignavibacteria bacterium]HRF66546.1 50S ribosomal protein L3 [Ignavibacteria bacterium]HRJ03725.1 50S ribosomal protein L3 [Ignavibacteria bacterium]HRJ85725.1 50S ribosomal protein L3 [Ignavibacteria bacterium]
MKGLIGKKLGMTSVFTDDGSSVPCTLIEAGPCYVTAVKTKDNDGYTALQLGFTERKEKRLAVPQVKNFKKKNLPLLRFIKEVRDFDNAEDFKVGDVIKTDLFKEGDIVKVTSKSKGKGFQGVVKRHGFGGGSVTHGQSDRLRAPGSIGASSYPSRVFKGQRMAGRTGGDKISVRNLKIVKIIPESNLLLIKGAVPGAISGIVEIYKVK